MNKRTLFVLFLLLAQQGAFSQQMPLHLKGPDNQIEVQLYLKEGKPIYQIEFAHEVMVEESPLGLETSIGNFTKDLVYVSHQTQAVHKSYVLKKGKTRDIIYEANELIVKLTNQNQDTLHVIFRASDRDVAFSYRLTTKERYTKVKIFKEATAFNLPDDATTYITPQAPPMSGWEQTKPSYEEDYTLNEPIGTPSIYGVGYTFPALFKISNEGWVLISETGVDSRYAGSRLGEGTKEGVYPLEFPQEGENNGMGATYVAQAMPAQTPWRTLTLGKTLKNIVESTVTYDLVDPLYEPSRDYKMGRATWSWIVWQDASINYDNQVKYIDLANSLGFEYVLIDNWWDKNIGRERMEELVKYANSKGVDVLLWYNSNGYWNDAPQTPQDRMNTAPARQKEMAWLQKIGVKGLKVDFFGGDKQMTMKLYEDILTDANRYGLTITFHGCTLPRGWEIMYPNYVTSEAVKASEMLYFHQDYSDRYAQNSTIFPFTRNAVGAMDFAPVFFNRRLSRDQNTGSYRRTTDAFEVATSVLFLSPVQHFGITPNNLQEQPDYVLDFIRKVPTVWDETVYIDGEPGTHCAVARRSGKSWYVALVNGEKIDKRLELDLPMLKGKKASLIYDKADRTAGFKEVMVNKKGKIKIKLLSEGGAVIKSK
ncbi:MULTISPECIES: glycoside hydrolase family 97 protein [Flavobacteriaceae]|uniref:glycoside hydrolase family 97 protein n=1 Tax=Flavobacteriaceae TaxID=49546 RepID=UPI001493039F|nr:MULTISPECIES: glycoside hydrolase family 97 protein [Allomuricauda]MDC6365879.1 glycoside hydrolase family 97 catalytic domain-containing protein [Muricauda sp. AC10]